MIYEEFKGDYYPGEHVTVHIISGERLHGQVRDKTRFGSKVLPDGTLTPPFSRYFVSLDGRPDEEAVVDDAHICRDRKVFTKSVLRSFIKKTVTREAWNGAPWLVRHDYAAQYQIDTRVPPHLRHDSKLLERKQQAAQKKASQHTELNGNAVNLNSGPVRLPELKPAPKNHKGKLQMPVAAQGPKGKDRFLVPMRGNFMPPSKGNPFHFPSSLRDDASTPPAISQPEPPPPPPPKYPIEDLQLEPREGSVRPQLKFLCHDTPQAVGSTSPLSEKVQMKSVGPLLETWDTLNVYCEVFKLDSFTFDDYVEAICIASADVPVQLFDEIHCSVLKVLVASEADGGKVEISLPELEDEEDEEDEEGDSVAVTPEPEPQPQPSGRTTRRSLAKQEADRIAAEAAAAEKEKEAQQQATHRAEELLVDYDWVESLRKRDFKDGGWQRILVGLFHQLSKNERCKQACEDLLAQLVPPTIEPSQESVRQLYSELSVDYKVQALQVICMLTTETKAIRAYMEDCSEQMTKYRKDKIELQRQRKQG
jgi:hypothetical protein